MIHSDYRYPHHSAPIGGDSRLRSKIEELEAEIERLTMVCEAMWKLQKQQTNYTDTDLIEKITELDLEDGRLDNRRPRQPSVPCPKCERRLSRRLSHCLYCGEIVLKSPFA